MAAAGEPACGGPGDAGNFLDQLVLGSGHAERRNPPLHVHIQF